MAPGIPVAPKKPLLSHSLWVGLGCKQGTPKRLIEQAVRSCFRAYALHEGAIAGVATIDTKRQEAGLIAFCSDHNLPLRFYAAERLRSVVVPHPSSAIDTAMGTPSVAEAAALLACWDLACWNLTCREAEAGKTCQITAAVQAHREGTPMILFAPHPLHPTPILHVPKQCYRSAELMGAVTIAVARLSCLSQSPNFSMANKLTGDW